MGFLKTDLRKGEEFTMQVRLDSGKLFSWSEETHAWAKKTGKYTLAAASSSTDIRLRKTIILK